MRLAVPLIILCNSVLLSEPLLTYEQEQCLRGRDPLTAVDTCGEVIASQADCLGEHASGTFWLKLGGAPAQQSYCDQSHSGGGWLRAVSFHHDQNNSCPSFPEAQLTREWEGLTLINGSLYCLKGGWREGGGGRSVVWNSARNISYSEVRGYAQLRLLSVDGSLGEGDGFRGPTYDFWEDDFADGLLIELLDTPVRHVYSYIIGSDDRGCPEAGGITPPPYLKNRERWYVCGHINRGDSVDEGGVYQTSPHTEGGMGGCKRCPSMSPWFYHNTGVSVSSPIRLRLVDHIDHPGVHIAVAGVELYVR